MAEAPRRTAQRWVVAYDGECGFCIWLLSGLLAWDRRRSLRAIPLQGEEASELLADLDPAERMASWHLISPAGERASGGAAIAPLLRRLPGGGAPAAAFAGLPTATERGYRWVAANRSGLSRWVPKSSKRRARKRVEGREAAGISG
jgi:predicted DCC family thiol-disulfide oxidoreductase YuxK